MEVMRGPSHISGTYVSERIGGTGWLCESQAAIQALAGLETVWG